MPGLDVELEVLAPKSMSRTAGDENAVEAPPSKAVNSSRSTSGFAYQSCIQHVNERV